MAASGSERFVYHSKEEIQQKIDESIPVNTKRANAKAARTFFSAES